jgi:hypothetical protein
MPVTKYRSISDMPRPGPRSGEELAKRIRAVWRRSQILCPATIRPGVFRFSSIEEANAARDQATRERMKATVRRR